MPHSVYYHVITMALSLTILQICPPTALKIVVFYHSLLYDARCPEVWIPANIRVNLIPESRVHAQHLRAESISLTLFVCKQLSSKSANSQAHRTGVKTEINVKWPFKVTQGHDVF